MRWIARRKAGWVVAAAIAVVGPGRPGEPPPAWSPTVGTPAPAGPGRLKHDAPERAGPPILIPPPDVTCAAPPAGPELVPGPPIVIDPPDVTRAPPPTRAELPHSPDQVRVIAVAAAQPAGATEPVPSVLPRGARPEGVEVMPGPPVVHALPPVPAPPAEGPPCPDPGPRRPLIQPPPPLEACRLPGDDLGYSTFADVLQGSRQDAPPASPYPRFALPPAHGFDRDFPHLQGAANIQGDSFEVVMHFGRTPDTTATAGGQHSGGFLSETNLRPRPWDKAHPLFRDRVWADDWAPMRVCGEFAAVEMPGNESPPLWTGVNRAYSHSLFVAGEHPSFDQSGRFGHDYLNFLEVVGTLDIADLDLRLAAYSSR